MGNIFVRHRFLLAAGVLLPLFAFMVFQVTDAARADYGAAVNVTMDSSLYLPSEITVTTGATVTWTQTKANIIHTVTSTDGLWDSGLLNPGDTFSFQFTAAGDYRYYCLLHYQMHGIVHVVDDTSGQ